MRKALVAAALALTAPVAATRREPGSPGAADAAVDEGSYFVSAAAAGYVTVILPVTLTSSRTIDFDLPLNPVR
jgi:hypothetical protein